MLFYKIWNGGHWSINELLWLQKEEDFWTDKISKINFFSQFYTKALLEEHFKVAFTGNIFK